MKTIITYGTFDLFHFGHLELLKRCKLLGDKLIVGLSTDEFNVNEKHKFSSHNYSIRKNYLESIKYVDLVIPESNWEQKVTDIIKYKVNIFVIGDDWKGKFDHLNNICEVQYLPRTPEISSTILKKLIFN